MFDTVAHPGRHDDRETGAVSAVIDRRKHMLKMVAVPILLSADTHDIVVDNHTGPHDICTGLIVVRILHDASALVHHGKDNAFQHSVGGLDILCRGEIALKSVRNDVRDSARSLERRKTLGQHRIHDGELGTDAVRLRRRFFQRFLVGDDGVGRTLAAGSRNGQHDTDGKRSLRRASGVEVPEVTVIGDAHCDGLCRIDDAAATDGQHKINLFPTCDLDPFVDQTAAGVGFDAAKLDGAETFRCDGVLDTVKQAGFFRRLSAVNDHDPAAAELPDVFPGFVFPVASEDKIGRAVKIKVIHILLLCSAAVRINIRFCRSQADRRT